MRILTIVNQLTPGGTERVAQNCAIAYAQAGHDSAVLAYSEGGPRVEPLRQAGVTVFVGGPDADGTRAAVAQARDWNADVAHVHRPGGTDSLGALLRSLEVSGRRLPIVETSHFARADYSRDHALVDVHIQISRWCMWQWQRWSMGQRPRPLGVLIPHMVRPDAFFRAPADDAARFRADHGIPADTIVLGRLGQSFDLSFPPALFDAFGRAAARDRRLHLVLVGAPDSVKPRIDSLPPDVAGRITRVAFLHGDESLRACYSALDAFLHVTAIGETFGLVLCESMLCEVPVITLATPTKGNSQAEVVGHNRGGLVAADVPSVVMAIELLARDPALARRLGRQGAQWVRRELDPQRITARLLTVLELAARGLPRPDLAAALARHADIPTRVAGSEIASLLRNMIGRVRLRDRIVMQTVANPLLYRVYDRLRRSESERRKFAGH
jgi:glycosyltransferase involved in cell wall biosynthesis